MTSTTDQAATPNRVFPDHPRTIEIAELTELPHRRAAQDPHGRCLSWPSEDSENDSAGTAAMNNFAFASAVAATASQLAQRSGTDGPAVVVGVLLRNGPEIITSMFAAWSLGYALNPINPALTDDDVRFQLRDSATSVLIGDERAKAIANEEGIAFLSVADSCFSRTPGPGHDADLASGVVSPSGSVNVSQVVSATVPAQNDTAFVVYTSGTTGKPKGCVLTYGNVAAMVASIHAGVGFDERSRSLLVLPLFHCNGLLIGTLAPLASGGSVHIIPKFEASNFWNVVEAERPTYFSAVPTIYSILESTTRRHVDTRSLEFVVCGAAPMAPDAITRFEEKFEVPVIEGYGLSECTVCATLNPIDDRRPGTVGTALPGLEVAAMDSDGVLLGPFEVGEVVVSGKTVMRGYLGLQEATAEVLHDGWLHTGDVGYLDEDGYLVLVDRIKDLIIRGGENIYPKEIEDALFGHPQVTEAAVVGRPDEKYGEVPVAHVALREGAGVSVEELQESLEAHLARFKVPSEIYIVESLPKNSVGKIIKGDLREK